MSPTPDISTINRQFYPKFPFLVSQDNKHVSFGYGLIVDDESCELQHD